MRLQPAGASAEKHAQGNEQPKETQQRFHVRTDLRRQHFLSARRPQTTWGRAVLGQERVSIVTAGGFQKILP